MESEDREVPKKLDVESAQAIPTSLTAVPEMETNVALSLVYIVAILSVFGGAVIAITALYRAKQRREYENIDALLL